MRYRNIKTQVVIETVCVISGGDWIAEEDRTASQPKRKTAGKKDGEEKK